MFEESVSPQGQKIWKVTVLRNGPNNRLQIAAHRIVDEKGKDICSATVEQTQVDPSTVAFLCLRTFLAWDAVCGGPWAASSRLCEVSFAPVTIPARCCSRGCASPC